MVNQKTITIVQDGLQKVTIANVDELHIEVASNIKAQLLLEYANTAKLNTSIVLHTNSQLNLLEINNCDDVIVEENIELFQDSHLKVGYYELGDGQVSLASKFHLKETGANVELLTSSVVANNTKHYNIECIHEVDHTYSDMLNYAIVNDGGDYEITACGTIKKGSYASKSFQNTRVLTTSDNQKSKVVPLLLIDENDVMASHANSVGQMNNEHLYYLMSRGLNRNQAKALLTLSYLLPLSDVLNDATIKDEITDRIRNQVGL